MTFEDFNLSAPLCRALRTKGYTSPTVIQAQAIPLVLAGRDVIGCAQTGTGKTAAFALPILHRLAETPGPSLRCLVLAPTRELASQIGSSFAAYGRETRLRHAVVFGGAAEKPQVQALRRGVDILVATPGRLRALIGQRAVSFQNLKVLVLDEADRMLDMGFIRDVRHIISTLPRQRQTLLFSATVNSEVQQLSKQLLVDPASVSVSPVVTTATTVEQQVFHVSRENKRRLLLHLLGDAALSKTLVFTRTKNGANRLATHLKEAGLAVDAIHGDKTQGARERALHGFRRGTIRVLVATDVAARGIDVPAVSHVINFDIPEAPESYIHRIGRTGRGGATGRALSFCGSDEHADFRAIERTIRLKVQVNDDHPFGARIHRDPVTPFGAAEPRPESKGGRPAKPQRPQWRPQGARNRHRAFSRPSRFA